MPTVRPCLWFDNNLEEAMAFYAGVFPEVKVTSINRLPGGDVVTAEFEIAGQPMMALNGGPQFTFNEAVSFFVSCDDQAEVDRYWALLTADGGEESMCGWLKDRFGLSWQIVPRAFERMMSGDDPEKVQRMVNAMLQMRKLDIAELSRAYNGT